MWKNSGRNEAIVTYPEDEGLTQTYQMYSAIIVFSSSESSSNSVKVDMAAARNTARETIQKIRNQFQCKAIKNPQGEENYLSRLLAGPRDRCIERRTATQARWRRRRQNTAQIYLLQSATNLLFTIYYLPMVHLLLTRLPLNILGFLNL